MGCTYFRIMAGSKSEIGKGPVTHSELMDIQPNFRILSLVFYIKVFAFIVKL